MNISDVQIYIDRHAPVAQGDRQIRIAAYATVVFEDCFLVRDFKILTTQSGRLSLCMPAQHCSAKCPDCRGKNRLAANYCNWCGRPLPIPPGSRFHTDMAYPTQLWFRTIIDHAVLGAYRRTLARQTIPPSPLFLPPVPDEHAAD